MADSDLSGRKLGNCTLEKLLGQGGMGAVYLAKQERPARYVAVKTLHPNLAVDKHGNEEFLARFRREADVIARLEHVNIMPVYEYGEQDGIAYLVMPHVSGGSIKDVLQKRGALTLREATSYIDQAASALDYAHSQGVVHRDLKPANFLLHADGRLVLADFGIARIMEESVVSGLTSAGTILGTPEYMAPEMASGGVIDYRADIYELGVVLYQMLTGKVPFSGTSPYAIVIKQIQERLPSVQQSNPALPATVDAVLQKATAKLPDDRYQAAQAMAQALHQVGAPATGLFGAPTRMDTSLGGFPSAPSQPLVSSPGLTGPSFPSSPNQPPLVLPSSAPIPYDTRTTNFPGPGMGGPGSTMNTAWNTMGQSGAGYAPTPPVGQYPPQSQYLPPEAPKRQSWGLIIGIILLLIFIVGGGIFATMLIKGQTTANTGDQATPTTTASPTPSPTPTTAPSPTPTAMPSPTPTPATMPIGSQLYSTASPSCDQDGAEWAPYNGAQIDCQGGSVNLTNSGNNNILEGMLLSGIPGGGDFPSDYTIQAQMQQESGSGDFGLYFRNQQGDSNQGVYTFMVHSDNTWNISVYDNNSGAATILRSGQLTGVDLHGSLQLGVVASGSQFNAYINGQYLTSVTDGTYPTGTVGLVVSPGTSVQASNFVLSNVATS